MYIHSNRFANTAMLGSGVGLGVKLENKDIKGSSNPLMPIMDIGYIVKYLTLIVAGIVPR